MKDIKVGAGLDELLKEISKPTEERPIQGIVNPIVEENRQPETSLNGSEQIKTENIEPVKPPTNLVDPEYLENSAELIIGMFDISETQIFKFLGKKKKSRKIKKLFGEDGEVRLNKLLNELDLQDNPAVKISDIRKDFTNEEISMLRIEKTANEFFEDLPMSEEEKERLKIPLIAIMKKRGGELSPEMLFSLAILQITGGRVAEYAML